MSLKLATVLLPTEAIANEERSDLHASGRVLVLLSDPDIGTVVAQCLAAAGFDAWAPPQAQDDVSGLRQFSADVVVLDSKRPDFDGTSICRRLRAGETNGQRAVIVTLIRDAADIDPRVGLELGPCDFVLYPLRIRELVLRIHALAASRRGRQAGEQGRHPPGRRYLVGPLEVDTERHCVKVCGVEVHMSTLEMRLLCDLIENRGRVRTRKDLLRDVWGYSANVSTRTPDTHVNRLRMKLGVAGSLVETVRSAGYRLSTEHAVVVKD
ncbi:MAG: response regulator transcription factor [Haliangium ochraceum]